MKKNLMYVYKMIHEAECVNWNVDLLAPYEWNIFTLCTQINTNETDLIKKFSS